MARARNRISPWARPVVGSLDAIAVREEGVSRLLVIAEMPPTVDEHVDLGEAGLLTSMIGALDTLFLGGKRMLRVFGKVGESANEFELIMPDKYLRAAMLSYSRSVALVSLAAAALTVMVFFDVTYLATTSQIGGPSVPSLTLAHPATV